MAKTELKSSERKLIEALPRFLQRASGMPLADIVAPHLFQIFLQNDDRHWHINDHYFLVYCLTGVKTLFSAEEQITLSAGDAVILPANVRHRFQPSAPETEVLLFSFYSHLSAGMISKISGESFTLRAPERKILFDAVRAFGVSAEAGEASFYFAIALNRIIRRLTGRMPERKSFPEHGDDKIMQANMIIQKNLHRRVTLAELARTLNVSVSALQKIFYAKMKCGLGRYALNQRLLQGSKLLRSSDMSIGEIAYACGFESETTFRRAFKRETGYSPSHIRKIAHGIIEPGTRLKSNGFPEVRPPSAS